MDLEPYKQMIDIGIIFCDQCENIAYPKKWDDKNVYFECRCGNTQINPLIQEITIEEEKEEKELNDIYNFKTKQISRKVIYNFLSNLRQKGLIKPFEKQKVMILTHIEGYDIKEILLPLGYKMENIHIFEKVKSVFESIKTNPFFNDCKKSNIDLKKYRNRKDVFDLIYLDFKSNLSYDVLKIISYILINNTHSSSVIYINTQMAREISSIMEMLKDLENKLMKSYDEHLDKKKESLEVIEMMKNLSLKMFGNNSLPYYYDKSNENDYCELKIGKEKLRFDRSQINIYENHRIILEKIDEYKRKLMKEENYKKRLNEKKNYHLLRQKALQLHIQSTLNIPFQQYKLFSDSLKNNKPISNINIELLPNIELNDRENRVNAINRYLTNSLIPLYFTQFIYKNDSQIPFLNTLFLLKNERDLLKRYKFNSFTHIISDFITSMHVRNQNLIKQKALTKGIKNFFLTKEILTVGNEINMDSIDSRMDKYVKKRLDYFIRLYSDLKKNNMLLIDIPSFEIRGFNSNTNRFCYHGSMTRTLDAIKRIPAKNIDVSPSLISFILVLKLLKFIETYQFKQTNIEMCPILEINSENDDIDIILSNMNLCEFNEELIDKIILYRKYLIHLIRNTKEIKDYIIDLKQDNKIKHPLEEINYDFNSQLLSIKKLINIRKVKKQMHDKEDMDEFITEFIEENKSLKSKQIAQLLNEKFFKDYGYNPQITEHSIRARKAWKTMKKKIPN